MPSNLELVQQFYEKYNNEKLNEVPAILNRWKGKERLLLAALHKKYGVPYNPTQEEEEVLAELVAQTEERGESQPSGDSESMNNHGISSNPELRQRLVSMCQVFPYASQLEQTHL
jgi:hypothetical protein